MAAVEQQGKADTSRPMHNTLHNLPHPSLGPVQVGPFGVSLRWVGPHRSVDRRPLSGLLRAARTSSRQDAVRNVASIGAVGGLGSTVEGP